MELRHFKKVFSSFLLSNISYKILSSGILVSSLLFLGKLFAFLKELMVAQRFGVSDSLETFLIAFVIPTYFINILINSIGPVLMSTLISFREKMGEVASHQFLTKIIFYLILFLIMMLSLLFFLGNHLIGYIGSEFSEEKLLLTISLFYWIIISIPLRVVNSVFHNFLDSKKTFFITGLAPLGTTLTTIFALLFLFENMEVYAMIVGLVGGSFVEGLWYIYFSKRVGFKFRKFSNKEFSLSECIGKQYLVTLIGIILICSFPLIDSMFAARLISGSVAYLSYGEKVTSFFLMFILSIFGTAVLPYISEAVAKNKIYEMVAISKFYLRLIMLALIPLSILLSYFSPYIVNLVFFTTSFTLEDKDMISSVQSIFLLQIPFYASVILLTRIVIVMRRNYLLLFVNMGAIIFKLVVAYYLSSFYGVKGIAASTVLTLLFMACNLGIICFNLMKNRLSHVHLEIGNKDPAYSL